MAIRRIGKNVARARVSKLPKDLAPPPYETTVRKSGNHFNQAVCEKIVEQVRAGDPPIVACRVAGITTAVLSNWIRRAENGEPVYQGFFEELKRAEAEAESRRRALVELAARGGKVPRRKLNPKTGEEEIVGYDTPDAKAAQFLLERGSSRKRWGKTSRLEVTGKGGAPLNFAGWTNEQVRIFAETGERPDGTVPSEEIKPGDVEASLERLLED